MAVVLGTNGGFVETAPTEDPAGSSLTISTIAWATKHTAPAGATKVTEIGVYINNASEAADIDVGIYSHDSDNDKPDVLLGSATIAKGTGAGWKIKTGLNIAITPETTYWVAAQCDATVSDTYADYSTGGVYLHRKDAQTSLTNPWGETTWSNAGIVAAIYAVWEAANAAPTISSVADYPDPEKVGNDITFSVDWNDADAGELVKIHICKTDTLSSYACETNQVWCETGTASDDDPETCTYPTTSGDIGSNTYYAFVCDDEDSCSDYTSSTFTVEAVSTPSKIFKGGTHFK